MKVEITPRGNNCFRIKIFEEDFTLGNILQRAIEKSEKVEGVGVVETHPLEKAITLQVYLKEGANIEEILREGAKRARLELEEIKKAIQKSLGEINEDRILS